MAKTCPALDDGLHCWQRTSGESHGDRVTFYTERCRHCPAVRQVRERLVVDVVQHYEEGWRPKDD